MKITCKECQIELSTELVELTDKDKINENDQSDFLPIGTYFISDGQFFTETEKKIIINLKDVLNSKNHSDDNRLNGCCGPCGMDGLNEMCKNGHEIGTVKQDCWMPHCIIFEPENIETI